MRPVSANAVHGALLRRPWSELLVEAVGTKRRAPSGHRARVACFLDDLADKERVAGVDTCVDHRHHGSGAVEAVTPGAVGTDERDALREYRLVHLILDNPPDEELGRRKLLDCRRTDLEGQQR